MKYAGVSLRSPFLSRVRKVNWNHFPFLADLTGPISDQSYQDSTQEAADPDANGSVFIQNEADLFPKCVLCKGNKHYFTKDFKVINWAAWGDTKR